MSSAYKGLSAALADMPAFKIEYAGNRVDLERRAWTARKAGDMTNKEAISLFEAYAADADYMQATKTACRYSLPDRFEAAVEGVNAAPQTKPIGWDAWITKAREAMKSGKMQAWETCWQWNDGEYELSCVYQRSFTGREEAEDTERCHHIPASFPYDPRDKPIAALDLQPF